MRGQPRCEHCKARLPDLDDLQQAIDENPRLQKYVRRLRRSLRRREKVQKMIDVLTGNAPRPSGFYVALSIVPGLGHIVLGLSQKGGTILAVVAALLAVVYAFYGTSAVYLAVTVAALVHTYAVCDLMKFRPRNGFAAFGLTAGLWTLLALCFYLPIVFLIGRLGREVRPDELAEPLVRTIQGYSLLGLMMLCGAAFLMSVYYNAKSRPPNDF